MHPYHLGPSLACIRLLLDVGTRSRILLAPPRTPRLQSIDALLPRFGCDVCSHNDRRHLRLTFIHDGESVHLKVPPRVFTSRR